MTDAKAPEPSIEEILASIRKIISDDDPDGAESEPIPMADPEPAAMEEPQEDDTVLDLTEVVEEAPAPSYRPEPEPVHMEEPEPEPSRPQPAPAVSAPIASAPGVDALASERTVAAASGAIAKLAHYEPPLTHGSNGKTVEEIVRELLTPMLREWIDQNLAGIVERLVDRELKKISRKAEDS